MSAKAIRILRVLFVVYVVATAVHIAFVVNHEPFAFDAWNVAHDTRAEPFSIGRFFEFWHREYTTSNPRLGQPLTYFAYKLTGVGEVGTALAFLAVVLACFVLAAGRFPDPKRGRDLATLAIGIGFMWFISPNMPAYIFCRAYATNYLWAAAIQLWFLVPLRLHVPGEPFRPKVLVPYFVLGVAAGMCNEHTGPTLLLFATGYAIWLWRKKRVRDPFAWAGALGTIVGFGLIFFAPGQEERYEDFLQMRLTLTEQIIFRGVRGNLEILQHLLFAAAPLLLLIVTAVGVGLVTHRREGADYDEIRKQQREALKIAGLAIVAGILISMTLFASPKLGVRFYMHSMFLLLMAFMGVLLAFLHRVRTFAPFVVIAVISSGYAAARTIPLYSGLAEASETRLAALAAAPPGTIHTVDPWDQVPETWWFLGDDFRDQKKREMVAKYFGLYRVLFRGGDTWSTLGVADVKLLMQYETEPPVCLDEVERLDLKPYIGKDVAALHRAFEDAIAEVRYHKAAELRSADLMVSFLGVRPKLPRETLYIARWADGEMERYLATMKRASGSKDREIVVGPELARTPWEMWLVPVGGEPRKLGMSNGEEKLLYRPWQTGQYWVLACKPEYCFVTHALRHKV